MKRAILTKYGGPEVLEIQEYEPRELKDGQALVENYASSVNPVEINIRKGKMKILTGVAFPKQFGSDFSGMVVQSKIPDLKIGEEIFGIINPIKGKTYNAYVIIDKNSFAKKPKNLNHYEAGVLGIVGLTAYTGVVEHGKIQSGQKVFINGCTGGVGSMAVKMAKALGAEVTGTCSPSNFDFAKKIGVDYPMDYSNLHFQGLGDSFDFIFDAASNLSLSQVRALGKKGSRAATTTPRPAFLLHRLFSPSMKILNSAGDVDKLDGLQQFVERHDIKPEIGSEIPLEKIADAHRQFEEGSTQGKMLIKIK